MAVWRVFPWPLSIVSFSICIHLVFHLFRSFDDFFSFYLHIKVLVVAVLRVFPWVLSIVLASFSILSLFCVFFSLFWWPSIFFSFYLLSKVVVMVVWRVFPWPLSIVFCLVFVFPFFHFVSLLMTKYFVSLYLLSKTLICDCLSGFINRFDSFYLVFDFFVQTLSL